MAEVIALVLARLFNQNKKTKKLTMQLFGFE